MEVSQNDNDKEDFAKDTSEVPTEPTPDPGDDAIEEINSPEEADQDTQMQAAKDDNTSEPAAGFGIKISSIASTASENQEEKTGTNEDEDISADKEPTAEFGIKISSIASNPSEILEEDKEPAAGFGIKISSIASTASESLEEDKEPSTGQLILKR